MDEEGSVDSGEEETDEEGIDEEEEYMGNVGVSDDGDSSYTTSDDLASLHYEDEEDSVCFPSFIPERDGKDPQFSLGMLFASGDDFREVIRQYSI